jgi:type II secretory pathway pseudopilin PulG
VIRAGFRGERGFTFVEALVAMALLAGLVLAILQGISATTDYQRSLHARVRAAGVQQRVLWLLSTNSYVRQVLLPLPENGELARCLQEDVCDPQGGKFIIPGLKEEPGLPPLRLTVRKVSSSLALVQGDFETTDAGVSSIQINVLLPLAMYWKTPSQLPKLACGKDRYLNGVELWSWTPICAAGP